MHLTLHLTDRCNLACRYCYQRHGASDMPRETAEAAIDRLATGNNPGIVFFGGEPLLRKDLMLALVDRCEAREPNRFHYKVTTNGTLLDESFLAEAGRRRLAVALSCDGVRAAHDAFRVDAAGRGTWERVEPALRLLLAHQPYAPVMMTVSPSTVPLFAESVLWLRDLGVRYLIPSLDHAAAWTDADLRALRRAYRRLGRAYVDDHRRGRKFWFAAFDKRIAARIHPELGCSCRLGRRQISVAPDGALYPCVQFVGHPEWAIGSVEGGLDEARREALFCRNEAPKPSCAGCALEGRCHNRCACLNFQTTGGLETVPPILCEHERILQPLCDELAATLYAERNPLFLAQHYDPAFPIRSILEDLGA